MSETQERVQTDTLVCLGSPCHTSCQEAAPLYQLSALCAQGFTLAGPPLQMLLPVYPSQPEGCRCCTHLALQPRQWEGWLATCVDFVSPAQSSPCLVPFQSAVNKGSADKPILCALQQTQMQQGTPCQPCPGAAPCTRVVRMSDSKSAFVPCSQGSCRRGRGALLCSISQ